jgi:hypothetical protein
MYLIYSFLFTRVPGWIYTPLSLQLKPGPDMIAVLSCFPELNVAMSDAGKAVGR